MQLNLFSGFSQFHFAIPLSANVLVVIFLLVFAIWAVLAMMLNYHWGKYGPSKLGALQMNLIFFSGSVLLLTSMIIFYLLYYFSA